jgi:membrane-bound serine protease (ClpP class)
MLLVIGLVLSLIFLKWPWPLIVIVPLAALEAFEIMLWARWRRVRAATGAEAMIGSRGVALTDCRPEGQVRVGGRIWKAKARDGVSAGEQVVVEAVDDLSLSVARC